jgi:hypothetical protein
LIADDNVLMAWNDVAEIEKRASQADNHVAIDWNDVALFTDISKDAKEEHPSISQAST